jgi:hypothetical protein
MDSMIWGEINRAEEPYTISIRGASTLSKQVHDEIEMSKQDLSKARAEFRRVRGREVEVYLETDS